jgi:uncharacterized protein YuzE
MKITYDTAADAPYIQLRSRGRPSNAVDVAPGVVLDVDAKGRAFGLEVLWASETMSDQDLRNILYEELVSEKKAWLRLPEAHQSPTHVGARNTA